MKRAAVLALVLLVGCGREAPSAPDNSDGAKLESVAQRMGMLPDARRATLGGSWGLDTDRACIVGEVGESSRIGVLEDYGDGQGCAADGTVRRDGERLDVTLGGSGGECRFRAQFDGTRIVFPAEVPAACQSLCTGRATLDAFAVERISDSESEAATLRTPGGRLLCAAP